MEAPAFPAQAVFPSPSFHASDDVAPPSVAPEPPLDPAALPSSFTAELLGTDPQFSLRREAMRFGIGIGLAALYGVALGVRSGGLAFIGHTLGVPAALLAALGLGVPALYIALALFDAPLALPAVISAASRSAASTGLVLAGLAPVAGLFVVSCARNGAASLAALTGLILGGSIGVGRLIRELRGGMDERAVVARGALGMTLVGFAIFAVAVASRIWWATLPVLRGGL